VARGWLAIFRDLGVWGEPHLEPRALHGELGQQALELAGELPRRTSPGVRQCQGDGQVAPARRHTRALEPDNWAVNVDLGHCLYQTRRLPAAEEAIRAGIRLAPGEARAHYHLGIVLLRTGRAGDAAAAFRRAIALDPSLAPANAALAEALRAQGHRESAADGAAKSPS